MLTMSKSVSPISNRDWSFRSYLECRISENAKHISGDDIPDYAYGMDYELRKKLDAIPGLRNLAGKYQVTVNSQFTQNLNRNGVAVGPTQFPDVYDIACDCARRLGIAVPAVYLVNDTSMNASTMCSDDTQPVIMLHSGLYERVTPGELKVIIGHECGHIQNSHMIYEALVDMLATVGIKGVATHVPALVSILSKGTVYALRSWSRAAEVTSDRAGMICADDLQDAYTVQAKLLYGAAFDKEQEIDYTALERQLKMQMSNISKIAELESTHPSSVRRIMAEREFAECALLYDWRPDLQTMDAVLRSKEECDTRCKTFINLTSNKGAR